MPPCSLQPGVIPLCQQQQSCILSTAFREGETGKPRAGRKPNRGSPKLGLDPHRPSHHGKDPVFLAHAAAGCSGGGARGGMLGEARSHSSALLLGAAGDWRRVTSPLPAAGAEHHRASPAIFGSGTSAYRREARDVPPHGPTSRVSPREGQRAEPAAARTRHAQGVSLQKVTADGHQAPTPPANRARVAL